jgi:hypothetical protein
VFRGTTDFKNKEREFLPNRLVHMSRLKKRNILISLALSH